MPHTDHKTSTLSRFENPVVSTRTSNNCIAMVGTKPSVTSRATKKLTHHKHSQCKRRSECVAEALSRDATVLLFRWLVHNRQEQRQESLTQGMPDTIKTNSGVWKRRNTDPSVFENANNSNQLLHVIPDEEVPPPKFQQESAEAPLSRSAAPRYLVRPRFPVDAGL